MTIKRVLVVHGGELASDVANQVEAKKPAGFNGDVVLRNASERPKTLLENDQETLICFIIQTIENSAPTEEVSLLLCCGLCSFSIMFLSMKPRPLCFHVSLYIQHCLPLFFVRLLINIIYREEHVCVSSNEKHIQMIY